MQDLGFPQTFLGYTEAVITQLYKDFEKRISYVSLMADNWFTYLPYKGTHLVQLIDKGKALRKQSLHCENSSLSFIEAVPQ